MSDIRHAHQALLARILEGPGQAPASQRKAAFSDSGLPAPLSALVDKVARHAAQVTDDDIAHARASGLTEDQIFELVVCSAVGQATRQFNAARAALETATQKE